MKRRVEESEVTDYFDALRETDKDFAAVSARFGPLADFITEYEYLKESQGMTQKELADRAGTTQSAISRFEAMKHPPTYDLLIKISRALGDELFISPAGSQSLSLPYDLRDQMAKAAERRGISVQSLVLEFLRRSLAQEDLLWDNIATRGESDSHLVLA
jgi:transcriptional regulator with XRE-family HTH domain